VPSSRRRSGETRSPIGSAPGPIVSSSRTIVSPRCAIVDHRLRGAVCTPLGRFIAECNALITSSHHLSGDAHSLIALPDRVDRAARCADRRVGSPMSRRRLISSRCRIISFCECFVSSRDRIVSA